MIGKHSAQLSLSFGADDLDGTIDDTTKIYSMAGSKEEKPAMTTKRFAPLSARQGLPLWKEIRSTMDYKRMVKSRYNFIITFTLLLMFNPPV